MADLRTTAKVLTANRRRCWLCAALAVAVVAVALLGGALAGASLGPRASAANAAKVVGHVTSLSGSKQLYLKGKHGKLKALHKGDALHLGDTVEADRHVQAELKLSTPRGVSSDAELVYVRPVGKTEHVIKLNRSGNVVDAKIGD